MNKNKAFKRILSLFLFTLFAAAFLQGCTQKHENEPVRTEEPVIEIPDEPEPAFVPNSADSDYNEYERTEYTEPSGGKNNIKLKMEYDYELPKDVSELLNGAAGVNVFDTEWPFKLSIQNESGETVPYEIYDYYGKVLYSGTVPCDSQNNTVVRGVKRHPTGYFTVKAGEKEFHYAVTPPYSERTLDDSPFAMDFASAYLVTTAKMVYKYSAAAKISGVTWVRERSNWSDYEASKGKYSYRSTDAKYEAIKNAGLKNIAMLSAAPGWALDGPSISDMRGGFRKTHMAIYNLCKDMAKHYDGIVDAWELWNEEDFTFAAEPAELFAGWFKSGALGLKDSGADVLVSFGGFCMWGRDDYMPLAMKNAILDYSDIYNFHAHMGFKGSYVDFLSMPAVGYQLGINSQYNAFNKPLWITEAGLNLPVSGKKNEVTAEQLKGQAPYLVQSACLSLSKGTSKHFWFVLSPYLEGTVDYGSFSRNGINEPYPTVAAESVMTYMLGEGKYAGYLESADGIHAPVFNTGKGYVAVVWNETDSQPYTVKSAKNLYIVDMMGGRTEALSENGTVTVSVSQEPTYIKLKSLPDNFVSETYPACTAEATVCHTDYTVGQRVIAVPEFSKIDYKTEKTNGHKVQDGQTITVRLTNLNDRDVSGTLDIRLEGFSAELNDGSNITIKAMSEITVKVTLKRTSGNTGDYLTVNGSFEGSEISPACCHVFTE